MAIRDTQDVLITEQQWTSGTLRVTQDALFVEFQSTNGNLRVTQDALLIEFKTANAKLRVTQDAMIYEYPFINAMFVYQAPGSSVLTGFTPVFPPVKRQPLALWGLEAVRHDSLTTDGIKRSVLERIDNVTTLTFPYVAESDMAAWKAFEEYAVGGGTFAYRPNANDWATNPWDNTGFSTFKLIDMDWKPKFEAPLAFSLEMKLKLVKDM